MSLLEDFTQINPLLLDLKVFDLIDNQWMLITAGNTDKMNTMTASWGTLGILWNKPIAIIFIRPQRYTYEFIEANDLFSLSFFDESYRDALEFCGTKSGRDYNKPEETGLTTTPTPNGAIAFNEAELILECKKLYFGDIKEMNFLDPTIVSRNYPHKDFHRFYIGEIIGSYKR
ncbi:MAG: flavin reductase family protein [Bacteroidales bacterium]|nr:flavin reductase family protein [Bacteroidales bacterium]MBN2750488.1 flavin reductase family protein [Bacteroidales bacterium]